MATNPPSGDNHRNGQVTDHWVKRDKETGLFIDQKADDKPFKGVRKEK